MVNVTKTKSFKRYEMKNKILLTIALLCVAGLSFACNGDVPTEPRNTIYALVGTEWRLVGFFDIEADEITYAKPDDFDNCNCFKYGDDSYTLNFCTDSTILVKTIANTAIFVIQPNNKIFLGTCTKAYDSDVGNVQLLYDSFNSLDFFKLEDDDKLKIYYDSNKKYLLYRRVG